MERPSRDRQKDITEQGPVQGSVGKGGAPPRGYFQGNPKKLAMKKKAFAPKSGPLPPKGSQNGNILGHGD